MNLSDYLESKAEYLFDECSVAYRNDKNIMSRKEEIVNKLKQGLRRLAQIHDEEFRNIDAENKTKKIQFTGNVDVILRTGRKIDRYRLHIAFINWAFTKIMVETSNKKFEDLFSIGAQIIKNDKYYIGKEGEEGDVRASGYFSEFFKSLSYKYEAINTILCNPITTDFIKSRAINTLKGLYVIWLAHIYEGNKIGNIKIIRNFKDFYILSLQKIIKGENTDTFIAVETYDDSKKIRTWIKITPKEYEDIIKTVEYITRKEKIPEENIQFKNILIKYVLNTHMIK